jgi:hypothetical protein
MSSAHRLAIAAWLIGCALTARADDTPPAASATKAPPAQTQPASEPAAAKGAQRELQLETTQITGNRELPKVMVIVPWKTAEPAALAGRPVNSLVEEVLTPIDRDVMRRTLDYYKLLAQTPAPAADGEQAARTDTNQ